MPTAAFTLIGHLLCPDEQRAAIVLLEKAAPPPHHAVLVQAHLQRPGSWLASQTRR